MMVRPWLSDAVFIDFETITAPGYELSPHRSTRAYIEDERFDVLSVALACGTADIQFFHKLGPPGGAVDDGIGLIQQALAQGCWLVCHNSGFDALILQLRYGITCPHIFDTQDYAAYLGLGTSAANLARHLGMNKFEAPPFQVESLRDPLLLRKLGKYNANDVRIARRAFERAITDDSFPDSEFAVIDITERNNIEGLRLDAGRAASVAQELVSARNDVVSELASSYSFDTTKLGSNQAVSEFVEQRFGVRLPSLNKKDPDLVAFVSDHSGVRDFLRRRQLATTLRKYATQAAGYAKLNRFYVPLRYCGAHTGRFSGSGANSDNVNIQNLPKSKYAPHPAIARIRQLIVPTHGTCFVAADLNSMEARVVATLAGEETMLQMFRAGGDIYTWFGGLVFPGTRIVKDGENDHLRKLCKEALLGLGFGMGLPRFAKQVLLVDSSVSPDDVKRVFEMYQSLFPLIRQLKYNYMTAFAAAAERGDSFQIGRCVFVRGADWGGGPTVVIVLPTGRRLFYRAIEATSAVRPWGDTGNDYWYAPDFDYIASGKHRPRALGKVRKCVDGRLRTLLIPSTLVGNIVQAVARDVLMHQMLEAQRAPSLRPVFHVHDELVCECAACTCPSSLGGLAVHRGDCPWRKAGGDLVSIMSRVPSALPGLADLPLRAELSAAVRSSYGG